MFANFLYFIIVLLIHALYQPTEETNFTGLEATLLFFILVALFAYITRLQFIRLGRDKQALPLAHLDHRFHTILTQQSIMAVLLFAVNIFGQPAGLFRGSAPADALSNTADTLFSDFVCRLFSDRLVFCTLPLRTLCSSGYLLAGLCLVKCILCHSSLAALDHLLRGCGYH